jgi:plasmanylethanolamine desaturase
MEPRSGALYVDCSRGQVLATWLGAGLNLACVAACAAWLTAHAGEVRPAWPVLALATVFALFLGDFFSGLIHWATDTWFDELSLTRVVSIAREHHLYPQHILGYGFRDYVGYTSWPAALFFWPLCLALMLGPRPSGVVYVAVLVCGEVCALMFFGTHFHRLGHRWSPNPLVRLLQRSPLLITPQYHAIHHGGTHVTHYCVVNGWANVVCDAIGFWRGLERVIHALTGAVPRRNDDEWLARYREDRSFMSDPVPSLLARRGRERVSARS